MARKGKPYQRDFSYQSAWFGIIPRGGYAKGTRARKEGPMPQGLIEKAFGRSKGGLRELAPEEHLRQEARLQHLRVPVRYQNKSSRNQPLSSHRAAGMPYVPIDEYRTYGGEYAKRVPHLRLHNRKK